jgi:FixJ family two-component response regulator
VTRPLTLAVVEDDEDVRKALNRLLRSMGHVVRLFGSAEAFEADDARFDCVILDVRLPGSSGVELSERMRLRGSPLPVVFITGDGEPFGRDGSSPPTQTTVRTLAKPFGEDDLMQAVAMAMGTPVDPTHSTPGSL